MSRVPRTEEGRVAAVAAGFTINGTYALPPSEALEAFRADLRVLVGRPTEDAYMAACRALHWRTAQLHAQGIEPIRIPMDAPHYPPEGFDFGHGPATDISFLLSVIDSCDEAGAPSCEMEPEDVSNIARIRASVPSFPAPDLGFVDRSEGGPGRTSIKKSHRAEGRNFVD